jgi:hypothetical protein
LRINIQAADTGQKTPKEALNTVASEWDRISRRVGKKGQQVQWLFLKSLYPNAAKGLLA